MLKKHLHADRLVDVARVVGPYGWGMIHHGFESFPCPPCAETGGALGRAVHDVVNFHIGNPIRFPEDLEFLRESVNAIPTQHAKVATSQKTTPTLGSEILRLAQDIELEVRFPKCAPSDATAFERCVQQVKASGEPDSAFGICTVSLGCSPRRKA